MTRGLFQIDSWLPGNKTVGARFSQVAFGMSVLVAFFLGANSQAGGSRAAAVVCPFCSAVSQTLSEEILSSDVVVLAKLVGREKKDDGRDLGAGEVSQAIFEIVASIKGDDFHTVGTTFRTIVFGDAAEENVYLVTGINPPRTTWASPIKVSDREQDYILSLPELPQEGGDRLVFFLHHLEDVSSMLAADAYDEFARAPYADVIAIKDEMDHDRLVQWIQNEDIPASRKRLYLTMLGICGSEDDLPMLEELMMSPERRRRAGLDAMIACYLTLKGEAGMPLIEELFLANVDAEYADTYAAITALRFHGSEEDVIPKQRILEGLRLMLKRPRLADLVIPDLARWNDWEVIDELVQLFKDADETTDWVRVPVVNYLRACPLEIAKQHLKELEEIDPEAIKRANTFFPLPDDDDWGDDETTDDSATDDSATDDSTTDDSATNGGATDGGATDGGTAGDDNVEVDRSAVAVLVAESVGDESVGDESVGDESVGDESALESSRLDELSCDEGNIEPVDVDDSEAIDLENQRLVSTHPPIIGSSPGQTNPALSETVSVAKPMLLDANSNSALEPTEPDLTDARRDDGEVSQQTEISVSERVAAGDLESTPVLGATTGGLSPLSLLFSATFLCVGMFFVLWGLLTGRLLRLMA